jgi:hypothetical protein
VLNSYHGTYCINPIDKGITQGPTMARSEIGKFFEERVKVAGLSQIREIVFGSEDGLLVPWVWSLG